MFTTIADKVETTVQKVLPNSNFYHGRKTDFNEMARKGGDFVQLLPFITRDTENGANTEINLAFLRVDKSSNGYVERMEIVESMYHTATMFINEFLADPMQVTLTGDIQREPQFQIYAQHFSGCFVSIPCNFNQLCE